MTDLLLEKAKDVLILLQRKKEGQKNNERKLKELMTKMEDFEITHNLIDNE